MASVFTRIRNGEIPGYIVAQTDEFYAILDINPLSKGHVLVIPNQEVDYIFDIGNELLGRYIRFAKHVAKAIESVVKCKRIGMAVVGLEVPHAHIHLVPINHVGDINFERPKLTLSADEMKEICANIEQAFISLDRDS